MSKKVLVLCGSPRKGGNTDFLSDKFIRGAKEAGHEVKKIYIKDKTVGGCIGCGACQAGEKKCVQKDDMAELYEEILSADVVALVSPVYFYSWTSQMKAVLDRTFAIEQKLQNTTFYLISSGAAPGVEFMSTMQISFEQYVECFRAGGNRIGGSVFGLSANMPGDVSGTEAEQEAYDMGRKVGA